MLGPKNGPGGGGATEVAEVGEVNGVLGYLVIISSLRILLDPLAFRLLLCWPGIVVGDAGRERLRGVSVAEVVSEDS